MEDKRVILITGASTGIGRAIAERQAARGWRVVGTVRRPEHAEELGAAGITPLTLEVTDDAAVAALPERLAGCGVQRLDALVNNAGIVVSGPVEEVDAADWRRVLDVNVVAVAGITRALLPLLRMSRGHIINVSSVSGLRALPFLGPYAASKFALEALSDSLRRELLAHGVRVSVIEPGPVKTPIWSKAREERRFDPDSPYTRWSRAFAGLVGNSEETGLPVSVVADAAEKLLEARSPDLRVVLHPKGRFHVWLMRWISEGVLDKMLAKRLERGAQQIERESGDGA